MLRKVASVFFAFCALVFLAGAAWAITTDLTVTSNGKPLPGKTVRLTSIPHNGDKPRHFHGKTDKDGHLQITNVPLTDRDKVELTYHVEIDGGGEIPDIPSSQLIGGGKIDIGGGSGPGGGTVFFPPPSNLWLDLYLSTSNGCFRYSEYNFAGTLTSQNSACHDPIGGGGSLGYPIMVWKNVQVMPFASFDLPNTTVNYVFAGGAYLGTRANWSATFGAKAGPWVTPSVWLYGVGGVSILNETLTLSFAPGLSSRTTTVPGLTLGVGGAYKLQGFGVPISLFAELDWTWWQNATFNAPAPASQTFNYTFNRTDLMLKSGVSIALGGK
jgi:hypothetical protein